MDGEVVRSGRRVGEVMGLVLVLVVPVLVDRSCFSPGYRGIGC